MWGNYLRTAWRHFLKNRLFSLINVVGFAIGLMSCILIMLFVRAESGYDSWIPNHERIVRLHSAFYQPDRPPFLTVRAPGRIMKAMRDDHLADYVESGVRLLRIAPTISVEGNPAVFAEQVTFADPSFFDVFDLPFVEGDAASSFGKPMDLLISEEMAIKYFGRTDVVGETMTVCCLPSGPLEVAVTGVIENIPENSHLDIDFLALLEESMFAFAPNLLDTWSSVNTYTYFKMREGVTVDTLTERYYAWLDSDISPYFPILERIGQEGLKVSDISKPSFMKISDIYLGANEAAGSMGDMRALGDGGLITTFAGVAGLILLIAAINFTNLSTARATRRAREVAMRKVLGASRTQVAVQFLAEAVGMALLALMLAIVAVELVMPIYADLIDRDLTTAGLLAPGTLGMLALGTALLGILAGLYPALVLSRFLPAKTLKSNQSGDGSTTGGIRQALVVFQFAVSIGLAVCTAVVYGQTLFARTVDKGYTVENKLAVWAPSASQGLELDVMAQEMARLPGVKSAVLSSEVPTQDWENNRTYTLLSNGDEAGNDVIAEVLNHHAMGEGFFEAYDVKLLAGRYFSRAFGTDAMPTIEYADNEPVQDYFGAAVINESAARKMGFETPEEAVGRTLQAGARLNYQIVGVIEDLYFRSIKFGVRASIYRFQPDAFNIITLSFETNDLRGLVEGVEDTWRRVAPTTPLEHHFVDEMVANQYEREAGEGLLFAAFSALAILVASLGLYGLASFTAERRTKEMGIRKVMGARVADIIRLMVWQFSKPVLLANVIAWPVAWFVMQDWLQRFEYRLGDSFILVTALVAGLVALMIAWATVVGRSLAVARRNPIEVLRYE